MADVAIPIRQWKIYLIWANSGSSKYTALPLCPAKTISDRSYGRMTYQQAPASSFSCSCCRRFFPSTAITLKLQTSASLFFRQIPLRKRTWIACASSQKQLRPIPCFHKRGLWEQLCSRCYNISWKWLSKLISCYLLCLNLVAEAHDYPASFTYACEDVSNYYAHVKNLRGEALKEKLNSIVAPHHSLSYKEVWDALKILDAANVEKPEASPGVVEIYTLRVVSKRLSGKPQGWNREHLWPRSYGLTEGPSLTDLHNIRPADVNVNASRGNKYYGECNSNSTKCLKPANKEAALDTETDKKSWAPPKQVRGDIARALMYMAVTYGFHQPGGTPGLRLSDSPNIANKEMGLLSTLLKWNAVDPPSREEKLRNERICKLYQHNRNPFVDHPEYANLIWKPTVSRGSPPDNNVSTIQKKDS